MIILSVNAGSSSLKFTGFEMPSEDVLISGVFERIGIVYSFYTIKVNGEKIKKEVELPNHKVAFEILIKELMDNKIVESLDEIKGVGHRIVQGGAYFDKTVIADEDAVSKIDELASHLKIHKKDNHSRRGLIKMVADRRKHLKYLEKTDTKRHASEMKKIKA